MSRTRGWPTERRTRASLRALHAAGGQRVRSALAPVVRATYRTPRPLLASRHELPVLLERRGLRGLGFELGVRVGEFSGFLLDQWSGRLLVSVDPWSEAPAESYVDVANVAQARHDELYAETRERLAPFGERSAIWRTTSTEAAERVLPASADFVYIDARHDYPSVLDDLGQWYDKVRPGGVLAGHDYVDGTFPEGVFGVKSAVDEFFGARGVRVSRTLLDAPWYSWFVIRGYQRASMPYAARRASAVMTGSRSISA